MSRAHKWRRLGRAGIVATRARARGDAHCARERRLPARVSRDVNFTRKERLPARASEAA